MLGTVKMYMIKQLQANMVCDIFILLRHNFVITLSKKEILLYNLIFLYNLSGLVFDREKKAKQANLVTFMCSGDYQDSFFKPFNSFSDAKKT